MLADALVERYSRQILLPEVGGRGQERLGATRVTIVGRGAAAAVAARLLDAAGLRVVARDGEATALEATVGDAGVVCARDGVVATLVGRPCLACVGDALPPGSGRDAGVGSAGAHAIGALVAAEAIRIALGGVTAGRIQTVDLDAGTFGGRPLEPDAGCAACAGPT
jgi:molybdopterin/thiamine biosynthesis adenylyltransferase